MTDDFPEMPDFDPKMARRAVRRGLIRTTANVLAVLLALVLVVTVGSPLVQRRGDRERRMMDVLGTAFKLYNPAYTIQVGACCETTLASMSFEVSAIPMRPVGVWPSGGETYTLSQDFFGRVGHLPLGSTANTRLSISLYNLGGTLTAKEEVRKVLARLPGRLNALAVVEFATPFKEAELTSFLKRNNSCADKVVYERRTGSLPITWGDATWNRGEPRGGRQECGVGLTDFRSWVALLGDQDEPNLRRFDLSLDRLRKAAGDGRAYGYVDEFSSVEELREIIEDPSVRTVRLADVAFDLDRP